MLDWKSIKNNAQRIAADVSTIADEISASAKDLVADAKEKADETLVEVKSAAKNVSDKAVELSTKAKDIASETSQKATEIWNSEDMVRASCSRMGLDEIALAAKVLCYTAADVIEDPALARKIKEDHAYQVAHQKEN